MMMVASRNGKSKLQELMIWVICSGKLSIPETQASPLINRYLHVFFHQHQGDNFDQLLLIS